MKENVYELSILTARITSDYSRIELNFYGTFLCMLIVLLVGRVVTRKVNFLNHYDIPEPVTGGIIFAFIFFILNFFYGIIFSFTNAIKDPLLLIFYSTIGLSADFNSIKKGGKLLYLFAISVFGLLFVQNAVGVGIMKMLGENPLIGLLGGSITLSGGHGTGAAWGDTFAKPPYFFEQATDIAIACATYGLIAGGVIGGPMAHYLIKKFNLKANDENENEVKNETFESPQKVRLITSDSFITSLILISISLAVGVSIEAITHNTPIAMPTFVWCLFTGIFIRNTFGKKGVYTVFDREIGVIGNVALSLFLSMAIMSLNIVDLVKLAVPITILLVIQTIVIIIYVRYVTFVLCGKNYDSACLVAGHCGFGMGATPTAIANLQVVTNHFGMSHIAFILVPIMGGFLVDIANAFTIKSFLSLFFLFF